MRDAILILKPVEHGVLDARRTPSRQKFRRRDLALQIGEGLVSPKLPKESPAQSCPLSEAPCRFTGHAKKHQTSIAGGGGGGYDHGQAPTSRTISANAILTNCTRSGNNPCASKHKTNEPTLPMRRRRRRRTRAPSGHRSAGMRRRSSRR